MKICFITKYPPIEGGESSKAYWLIKGLGERGQNICCNVTNAWGMEDPFIENKCAIRDSRTDNLLVFIHCPDSHAIRTRVAGLGSQRPLVPKIPLD